MSTCTFFGHRSVHEKIEPTLRSTLMDLIENHGVTRFYIGNHGAFDAMVRRVLGDLSSTYAITYYVVLAYLPKQGSQSDPSSIFPEGIETVTKRVAISYRNKWMLERSEYVVTYVTHPIGSGAAQFKELAEKRGKTVIELKQK